MTTTETRRYTSTTIHVPPGGSAKLDMAVTGRYVNLGVKDANGDIVAWVFLDCVDNWHAKRTLEQLKARS